MFDQNNIPARTPMSHYLRTGQKIDGFRPDSYKSANRSTVRSTLTVRDSRERIILEGGRYVTVTIQNYQIFAAPLRITLNSYPFDEEGNQMTVFQNRSEFFAGLIPPLTKRTFRFDAGPVGSSNQHVLNIKPDTKATGAGIIVNVTLEARY